MMKNLFGVLLARDGTSGILDAFDFGDEGVTTIIRLLIAMAIGIILASVWTIYEKRYLGSLVRELIKESCSSSESAKTLYELGFDDKLGIRWALRRGNYSRWVVCVEQEEYEREVGEKKAEFDAANAEKKRPPKFKASKFRQDLDVMRYYVPEEKQFMAGIKYSSKGANWLGLVIVLILLAILLGIAMLALPEILKIAGLFVSEI